MGGMRTVGNEDVHPGEEVLRVTRPHHLAFAHRWVLAFSFWAAAVGISRIPGMGPVVQDGSDLSAILPQQLPIALLMVTAILVIWALSAVLSHGRWSRRWVFFVPVLFLGMGLVLTLGRSPIPIVPAYLASVGVLVAIATELGRRSYSYTITTGRLLLRRQLIIRSERQVRLEHVMDLVTEQGILGRLFDFGTVTPVTSSLLGTGDRSNSSTMGAGAKGPLGKGGIGFAWTRGRSSKGPSGDPTLAFLGVPHPRELVSLISLLMDDASPVSELQRIRALMESDGQAGQGGGQVQNFPDVTTGGET